MTAVIVGLCLYSNMSIELTFYECVNISRNDEIIGQRNSIVLTLLRFKKLIKIRRLFDFVVLCAESTYVLHIDVRRNEQGKGFCWARSS